MSKYMSIEGTEARRLAGLLNTIDLPTLPVVAQKLVELCRDDDASFSDFARVIEADPGLAARILRVTNSAYYGLRHKVTTLERAIGVLGLKYVKMTTLGFRLAQVVSRLRAADFDMESFWRQSLLRGVLARQIARHYCPGRAEEALLIGLLQDCGVPVLAELLGESYTSLLHETKGSQSALYALEREMCEFDHVMVTGALVDRWALPEILAEPVRRHHKRGPMRAASDEQGRLSQIAYYVATLSLHNPAAMSQEDLALPDYGQAVFGLGLADMQKVLVQSSDEYATVSQMFGELVGERPEGHKLVEQARMLLGELATDTVHQVFVLEDEVKRLRSRCAGLTLSVDEYARQAETDGLTGLSTRPPLERYLDNASWRVKNGETTLAVIFLDIDNFKEINNEHSHAAGDRLLQELALLLQRVFGDSACMARYGGDEFVVSLMGLHVKQAVQLARGLVNKIRGLAVRVRDPQGGEGATIRFSCSVGMLFCEAGALPGGATRVMELADNQMYSVKRQGKNDMRFQVISAQDAAPQVRTMAGDMGEAALEV